MRSVIQFLHKNVVLQRMFAFIKHIQEEIDMKKLIAGLCAAIGLALLLSGCAGPETGTVDNDLIAIAENAQYLPSRELLVKQASRHASPAALSLTDGETTPDILLENGLSENEYDALIEAISPVDSAFDRNLTVSDVKNEAIKILSCGVVFDRWFEYADGELSGYGSYFVSEKDGALTIMRHSAFQPWIYDAETGKILDNDDFSEEKPNYPIRSDQYLKIRIYEENDKEIVECEIAENLSYYDEVTPISYQFMRNVKDTSFTKLQVVSRYTIPTSPSSGDWGYDIDTDLPYGYMRSFTQLNYSSPDDIQWLEAIQTLPYAFNVKAENFVRFGSRSQAGGFTFGLDALLNAGDFSYTPSEEYLSVRLDDVIDMTLTARLENTDETYAKSRYASEGAGAIENNAQDFAPADQNLLNEQFNSATDSLTKLAESVSVQEETWSALTENAVFDCTAQNTAFEKSFNPCFDAVARAAIDGSDLAKDYLNNEIYNLGKTSINPAA